MKGFADTLPKMVKRWFAHAIAGAITADGIVDDDEVQFLSKAIEFLDSEDEVHELLELVKTKALPELQSMSSIDRNQAFRMMATITQIVANDGKLSKGEVIYLKSVTKKLGFSVHFSTQLINWAKKSADVKREFSELKKAATNGQNLDR